MGTTNEHQLAFDLSPTQGDGKRRVDICGGTLYLLAEEKVIDGRGRWADPAHTWPIGTKLTLVHVMSDLAGGEVRGYMLRDGIAYLRSPCYTGTWTTVDEAIARVFACEVAPYQITSGGIVQYDPRPS